VKRRLFQGAVTLSVAHDGLRGAVIIKGWRILGEIKVLKKGYAEGVRVRRYRYFFFWWLSIEKSYGQVHQVVEVVDLDDVRLPACLAEARGEYVNCLYTLLGVSLKDGGRLKWWDGDHSTELSQTSIRPVEVLKPPPKIPDGAVEAPRQP